MNPNLSGIGFMLGAMAVLSLMDASMKALAASYSPFQVAFMRGTFSIPFLLLWASLARGGLAALKPKRLGLHVARGLLAVIMLSTFVYALSLLPLTETYTLVFVAPMMITLMSVFLLKEKVTVGHWIAIAIGFSGVVVVFLPNLKISGGIGAIVALFSAVCYSTIAILTRQLGKTETSLSMAFSFIILVSLGTALLSIPNWTALNLAHWPWFLTLGASGALGQFLITEAFRRGEASAIAPFEYTALLWGLLFDLFIWGKLPGSHVYLGAAIIIASGIWIMSHQHRKTFPPEAA